MDVTPAPFNYTLGGPFDEYFVTLEPGQPFKFNSSFLLAYEPSSLLPGHRYLIDIWDVSPRALYLKWCYLTASSRCGPMRPRRWVWQVFQRRCGKDWISACLLRHWYSRRRPARKDLDRCRRLERSDVNGKPVVKFPMTSDSWRTLGRGVVCFRHPAEVISLPFVHCLASYLAIAGPQERGGDAFATMVSTASASSVKDVVEKEDLDGVRAGAETWQINKAPLL
jgi:hypothetical protein